MVAGFGAEEHDALLELLGRCTTNLRVERAAYETDACLD
jgi:hypothetical protein